MKQLVFAVTNDLSYDQRMIRICSSLSKVGYSVLLVGRRTKNSIPLISQPFKQKRLNGWFSGGKLHYVEYNFRLFRYLLFKKTDLICAIDLDTILPCYFISKLKRITRVYDAHELFCEMKEVISRPSIYRFWKKIEQFAVPKFKNGYTVNELIAEEFGKMYAVKYEVIRNVPCLYPLKLAQKKDKYILYQGAVNEGRSFETLIPAMKNVSIPLVICGDGNFMQKAKELVKTHQLETRVIFKGRIPPAELKQITLNAWAGLTLFENKGKNNYYSLGNRFFDYLHAGLPQLCVAYPAYRSINEQFRVAVLTNDLAPSAISTELNRLLTDQKLYDELQLNCLKAREVYNWQQEERKLLEFYDRLMN